ncbi:MAG: GNAT family N-acetyltransferase, partial [Anaerolineales bacterium]|nr:GNAT family N-acetyltransferase [Anaerolineales bacterium]
NYAIFPLKALKAEQLPVMARLHLDDHGLLSQLGYPFVLKYFELVVNDAHVVGVIAVDNATHELIGYNIASPKPAALIAQLTKDKRWFLKEILKVALTRPAIFVQLLVSNAAIKIQMDDEADAIESLYLTIDERYRGQKVGRTLQQGLFEEARKAGYKRIVGSVETWNEASLRMCLSNGFVVKKTFREGKFIRHRIEKTL